MYIQKEMKNEKKKQIWRVEDGGQRREGTSTW